LAIGRGAEQPTGDDRTLIATENAADISRGRIVSTLSALGLSCTFITSFEHADDANTLIELDGFVAPDDPRLEQLQTRLGKSLYRLLRLGSYAVPLPAAVFAAAPQAAAGAPVRFGAVAGAKG
jgi:hypothetical protein